MIRRACVSLRTHFDGGTRKRDGARARWHNSVNRDLSAGTTNHVRTHHKSYSNVRPRSRPHRTHSRLSRPYSQRPRAESCSSKGCAPARWNAHMLYVCTHFTGRFTQISEVALVGDGRDFYINFVQGLNAAKTLKRNACINYPEVILLSVYTRI